MIHVGRKHLLYWHWDLWSHTHTHTLSLSLPPSLLYILWRKNLELSTRARVKDYGWLCCNWGCLDYGEDWFRWRMHTSSIWVRTHATSHLHTNSYIHQVTPGPWVSNTLPWQLQLHTSVVSSNSYSLLLKTHILRERTHQASWHRVLVHNCSWWAMMQRMIF